MSPWVKLVNSTPRSTPIVNGLSLDAYNYHLKGTPGRLLIIIIIKIDSLIPSCVS